MAAAFLVELSNQTCKWYSQWLSKIYDKTLIDKTPIFTTKLRSFCSAIDRITKKVCDTKNTANITNRQWSFAVSHVTNLAQYRSVESHVTAVTVKSQMKLKSQIFPEMDLNHLWNLRSPFFVKYQTVWGQISNQISNLSLKWICK